MKINIEKFNALIAKIELLAGLAKETDSLKGIYYHKKILETLNEMMEAEDDP